MSELEDRAAAEFCDLTEAENHQEDYWYPNPDRACRSFNRPMPCGTVLHWYLGVHILAGWVFAILGIAGLLAKPPS